MVTGHGCEATCRAEELVCHELDPFPIVHCPAYTRLRGRNQGYDDAPATDTR